MNHPLLAIIIWNRDICMVETGESWWILVHIPCLDRSGANKFYRSELKPGSWDLSIPDLLDDFLVSLPETSV